MQGYDISKYGVPRELTTCPGCNRQYGHHRTKICLNCHECSKCCQCKESDLKPAAEAIEEILDN